MTHPFDAHYSTYYDLLYRDKDYAAEAAFVVQLIERHAPLAAPPASRSLLDLACGTGRHAIEFARRGFRVAGSDQSPGMLRRAAENCARAGLQVDFYPHSFQTADRIGRRFVVVTSMFSAIDYITTYGDLAQALRAVGRLLEPGGLFIFDFWNGNAVLDRYSPVRVKEIRDGERRLLRTSETTLDRLCQTAHVHYHVVLSEGTTIVAEFDEDHHVRYYFPQEMTDFLEMHGFEVVQRCPFMRADAPITPLEWNLSYVARKSTGA
jgi:SAM-dependent methyltransferase